jgi:hypothetical protein
MHGNGVFLHEPPVSILRNPCFHPLKTPFSRLKTLFPRPKTPFSEEKIPYWFHHDGTEAGAFRTKGT